MNVKLICTTCAGYASCAVCNGFNGVCVDCCDCDNKSGVQLNEICTSSDSKQAVKRCWCPDCRDERKAHGVRKERELFAVVYWSRCLYCNSVNESYWKWSDLTDQLESLERCKLCGKPELEQVQVTKV